MTVRKAMIPAAGVLPGTKTHPKVMVASVDNAGASIQRVFAKQRVTFHSLKTRERGQSIESIIALTRRRRIEHV